MRACLGAFGDAYSVDIPYSPAIGFNRLANQLILLASLVTAVKGGRSPAAAKCFARFGRASSTVSTGRKGRSC
jgi:hypothetical protein